MKCTEMKYFVNFSQISSQCPITFLRINEAVARGLRISQNYIDTKSRFWAPFTRSGTDTDIVVGLPFFQRPASSEGGAADRSEKRQRRGGSAAGCYRQQKIREAEEV